MQKETSATWPALFLFYLYEGFLQFGDFFFAFFLVIHCTFPSAN